MAEQIGIIGLGIMGASYARNLSKAGLEVIGCDIDEARVAALAEFGVIRAASPADVVARVDRIITSLPFAPRPPPPRAHPSAPGSGLRAAFTVPPRSSVRPVVPA
jgi:predicted dinucleotide-binding enzyme